MLDMDNIRIRTHKDLSDVAERWYGFTFRQWISILITGLLVIPTYLHLKPVLGDEITSWIVIFEGMPFMLWGFVSIQNLTIDRLLTFWKRHYVDFYKPLQYKTEKELEAEKEAKKNKGKRKNQKETIEESSDKPEKEKVTRAMKKQLKKEKAEAQKIAKKQAKENRLAEKQKAKELRIERRQMKELAKAKKRFGEKILNDEPISEVANPEAALTAEDIQNIIRLGKKAEVIQEKLEQKKGEAENNVREKENEEREKA